jgi:hypothetical protein
MDTEELIRTVHLRKGLWDREHRAHRSLYALNKLWQEVAQQLNPIRLAVKSKLRSLRRGFARRLKQLPVSTSGHANVQFSNYARWQYFKHLCFLKDQSTPHANSEDIPPNEKKNLRDDQTDSRDGGSESLQLSVTRLCHEKEQISCNASTADITPKEKQTSGANLTDSQAGGLGTSQLSCPSKQHEPSDKVPKRKTVDGVSDFSDKSPLPNCKRLCLRKRQFTSQARTKDHPPEESNDTWHIQIGILDGDLVISEAARSRKERKPGAKLPRRRTSSRPMQVVRTYNLRKRRL